MALEQKLNLKLSQRLVMTPSLQQAIKLLQLSRLELGDTLAQEILENPILDVDVQNEEPRPVERDQSSDAEPQVVNVEPVASAPDSELPQDGLPSSEEAYGDIDVEAFFSDYLADSRPEGPSMAFRDQDEGRGLENTLSMPPGLFDHLLWQLHLISCPTSVLPVCEFILGNLDEDGFLRATDEEILEATGVTRQVLDTALETVRSLDPPGIATRTLQECLAAQIELLTLEPSDDPKEGEDLRRALMVVTDCWDDFLHQKWEKLAAELGWDLAEIKKVIDVVQRLETKPGRMYHQSHNSYVEPDVFVKLIDGEFKISLNDDGLPKLRINGNYSRMLNGADLDPKVATYLREKMRGAIWLMKSINQRQQTIYKVASSIVQFQRGFLEHGLEQLKPMVLRQVAEDIGMHESTISRVVSNKFIYTPRGLFPMKFFFHSGVDSARGGNISSIIVKDRIRKLVEAEEPKRPLSDSKIMKTLQREGIRLARRTVAKYREELGIPSSDKRKNVF